MGARRAEVVGQALPGIPIWKLGEGSRHPGIPYIVFPGDFSIQLFKVTLLLNLEPIQGSIGQYLCMNHG